MSPIFRGAVFVLATLAPALALGATPAAEVLMITGAGTVSSPTGGEVVSSAVNSYVNLKFSDGSFVLLRPNTRFVIEQFVDASAAPATPPPVSPEPAPPAPAAGVAATGSRAFFRLLRGGFRAVSGLIGHVDRNEYRVNTAVATIGIRGTDFVAVICDAACAGDRVLREELPSGVGAEGGLVTGVIEGGIGVDSSTGKGSSELVSGNYLVVTPAGQQLPLAHVPRFLQVDPIPNPKTICM